MRSVTSLLAHLPGLNNVAFGDVLVTQRDTALVALADLGDVVLLATQGRDLEVLGDNHTVAHQASLGAALDRAGADDRTGDVAELAGAEDLTDLRGTQLDLLVDRLEHALEGSLNVVDRGVDDVVVLDLDALGIRHLGHALGGTDVEADDDRVVDGRQVDVVLRDRTDAAVDDTQRDLVAHVDTQQRVFQGLDGTGHVALDDQVESVDLALGQDLVEVLQGDALAALGQQSLTLGGLTLVGDLAGRAVIRGNQERVTGARDGRETQDRDGSRRTGLRDVVTGVVEHRTHAAVGRADHEGVAHVERAALDQHGRDGAATLVQVRFDGDTARVGVRVGLEGQSRVGGQQDGLEQLADALALLGGDVHEHDVAAVLFRDQAVLGELGADLLRVRRVLIDLVDRDDDRHAGRLRVVDGLNRLGHDAVIGRDHEDRDVGDLGATGTHGREGLVTGGIDEGDRAGGAVLSLDGDLVGADVLGDTAVLGVDDVGVTDRVEQLGLTVVDVTHDGDDRRTGHHVLGVVELFGLEVDVEGLEQLAVLVLGGDNLDVVAELRAQGLEGVLIEGLRGGRHLA